MRKRWMEKSQTGNQTSPLPFETTELGECGSESLEEPRDWTVDEQGLPVFGLDLDDGLGQMDFDDWSFVGDSVAGEAASSSNKKPKIDIEDVEGSTADDMVARSQKSATSQGVEHLAIKTSNFGQFKFPWEKKRLSGIFSNAMPVKLEPPSLQPGPNCLLSLSIQVRSKADFQPVVKAGEPQIVVPSFCKVVKNVDDLSYVDERAKRRSEAISAWWDLLVTNVSNSTVGRQSTVDATDDTSADVGKELLDACFSLKSPGTLWKRLYGIKSFYSWHIDNIGPDWLPMRETAAWGYVKYLRDQNAPPTKASTFLEACRFAWYILGVDGAGGIESSLRIKGISAQMKSKKRAWQPASTLTLMEVKKLHNILEDTESHITDRLFCGHALHLLYGRSRWSDLLAVQHVFLDECGKYLELQTQLHKGTKSADTRSKLLPVVTPCEGAVPGNWARIYLSLREECGLGLPMEDPDHMMPAPADETGKSWRERYLTSEEGAEFLRIVLSVPKKSGRRISSHSLKSTTMSWASKFGISLESRAILARHATSISNPTVLYSRDLLSPVLREYDVMLQAIRQSGFEPDKTRSGMITPARLPVRVPGTPPSLFAAAGGFGFANQKDDLIDLGGNSRDRSVEVVSQSKGNSTDDVLDVSGEVEVRGDPHHQPSPMVSETPVLVAKEAEQEVELPKVQDLEPLSETSEDDSQQTTTSSEEEDGAKEPPSLPSFCPDCYYINAKSLVIHSCRNSTFFRCGRKISTNYLAIKELHGIRCSRCFDV